MFTLHFTCTGCHGVFLSQVMQDSDEICCPTCRQAMPFPTLAPGELGWFVMGSDKNRVGRVGPFSLAQVNELAATKQLLMRNWNDEPARPIGLEQAAHDVPEATAAAAVEAHGVRLPSSPGDSEDLSRFTLAIEDFLLLQKLGTGGMATVYLARQQSTRRLVALKILNEHLAGTDISVARFHREAHTLAHLHHGNIVAFLGMGQQRGTPFLVMEWINGLSTAAIVAKKGKLAIGDALHIILKCAEGLDYAWSQKIIHRDIKPENIMLTNAGSVKLADMGLAKSAEADPDLTDSGITLGSPRFMAPEQGRNAKYADHRSDLFALGGVLYQFLTGEFPFKGETSMELMLAKEQGRFVSARRLNPDVPPRLDLIIDKMLAKDPRHRYQTYSELIRDLTSLGLAHSRLHFNVRLMLAEQSQAPAAPKPLEILIIDDDHRDILLARQAVDEHKIPSHFNVMKDSQEGLAFLRHQGMYVQASAPNLIILGGNVLSLDCQALLAQIQADEALLSIPVVVLARGPDVVQFLEKQGFHVNLIVKKVADLPCFDELFHSVQNLVLTVAEQPEFP